MCCFLLKFYNFNLSKNTLNKNHLNSVSYYHLYQMIKGIRLYPIQMVKIGIQLDYKPNSSYPFLLVQKVHYYLNCIFFLFLQLFNVLLSQCILLNQIFYPLLTFVTFIINLMQQLNLIIMIVILYTLFFNLFIIHTDSLISNLIYSYISN